MKKIILAGTVALAAAAGWTAADEAAAKASAAAKFAAMEKKADKAVKARRTRAEIENSPAVLAKTGGFVDVEAKGVAVAAIDARKQSGGAADQFAEVFGRLSKLKVEVEKLPLPEGKCVVAFAREVQKRIGAVYAIVVEDGNAERSGLAVFPEDGVVAINAAKYREGADPVQREVRIVKQLWRGLGYVTGIGHPAYKNDVFQPVSSVQELDALEYQVMQPMNFQKMYSRLDALGVKRARHIPYKVAVMEGWAAAPTNDAQKAIWKQVHKVPDKPMTIEYNKKKGK